MGYKPVKWVITDIPYHPVPIGRLPVIWGTSALSSAPRIFPQWKWPWNGQNVSWPAQRTHVSWPLVDYKAERHQIQFWSLVTFPYIIYIYIIIYNIYVYILYIYIYYCIPILLKVQRFLWHPDVSNTSTWCQLWIRYHPIESNWVSPTFLLCFGLLLGQHWVPTPHGSKLGTELTWRFL